MNRALKQQRREQQETQRAKKLAASMGPTVRTEFVLIRHGETDWNKERRLQGQELPGPPLNELGLQQAVVLSRLLVQRYSQVDAVFSSDLLRTVQTAEVLAAPYEAEVQQHPGLRERHMGVLQGLTYSQAPVQQPQAWAALQSDSNSTRIPGGGESLDDLQERMTATLLQIATWYPGKRVLVVSHGGALHAVHRAARGFEAKGKVMNCSISLLLAEPTQVPAKQQLLLDRQLSALHEAAYVQTSCHSRQACQHCSSCSCTCCADGSNCLSSRSSSCSGLSMQCASSHTAVELISRPEDGSGDGECGCSTTSGCGMSNRCFRSVTVSCSSRLVCANSGQKQSGTCPHVYMGRLALISFNDAVAAYELAAEGVPMHGGSFGGSAREG